MSWLFWEIFPCWKRILNLFLPISSSFPRSLCQKSKKDHIYRHLSTAITSCYMKIFDIFEVHKVDRTVKFDIIWNSEAFTVFFLKKSLNTFRYCIFNGKTRIRSGSWSFFEKKKFSNVRLKSSESYIGVKYILIEILYACIALKLSAIFSININ